MSPISEETSPADKRSALMRMTYAEKLRHPMWQEAKLKCFAAANYRCEECGSPDEQLQCHHVHYITGKLPWEHPPALLMCLCGPCHKRRQEFEQELLINVATVIRYKSTDELRELPIWTFFQEGDEK